MHNSDKMSELSKLSGKILKVKIGTVDLELKPLNFSEKETLAKLFSAKSGKEQVDATTDFIRKVLKNSYPDSTDEELDGISFEHFTELSRAVMDVHGLKVSEEDLKKLEAEATSQPSK